MFFRSPLGRLISFVVVAIVIVVVILKVVDRGSDVIDSGGSEDKQLYLEKNFAPILSALTKKVGAKAELLNVTIRPDRVEFQVRNGNKADGYVSDGGDDFESVDVQLIGEGSIDATVFPLATVKASVPEEIFNAVKSKEGGKDIALTTETLERDLVNGELQWKINGTADGKGFQYEAKPNGSGLKKSGSAPSQTTSTASPNTTSSTASKTEPSETTSTAKVETDPQKRIENTQKYGDCVREAGTDIDKVRACDKYLK